MHGWYWNSEWHDSMMLGMAIFWLVMIIAVVVAFRYLYTTRNLGGSRQQTDSPEFILKQRFARGEIDRNEYEQRLAELRK